MITAAARRNPNASVALLTGLATSGIVLAAHKLGVTVPDYYATAAATLVVAAVLWIGRHGVRGAWNRVWNGAPR